MVMVTATAVASASKPDPDGDEEVLETLSGTIPIVRSRWLAPVAIAGVVVAHAVDFAIVYRGNVEREHQLVSTGHGYWPAAVVVAVLAGLVAFAYVGVRGGRRALGAPTAAVKSASIANEIVRLAVAQVGLFAGVELLERLAAGLAPGTLLRAPEFALGIVLQVVVAAVAVLVLTAVERLSERVVREALEARTQSRSGEVHIAPVPSAFTVRIPRSPARPRGPPLTALA